MIERCYICGDIKCQTCNGTGAAFVPLSPDEPGAPDCPKCNGKGWKKAERRQVGTGTSKLGHHVDILKLITGDDPTILCPKHKDAPRVLNRKTDVIPPGAVYIDRGTKWGNPFRIGPDGSRDGVCDKHEEWLPTQQHLVSALLELRGKDLVCFCAPLRCHGDLLLREANKPRQFRIMPPDGNEKRDLPQRIIDSWPEHLPWDMLDPHQSRALKNHNQTIGLLSFRGGLSPHEAYGLVVVL